ncbi:MAG: hypothetical protein QY317_16500 [Candidatus Jettenia caeni]|nr:MAG: hypothetical protein QY317_16500 [Candidatus Jettenia caeni]
MSQRYKILVLEDEVKWLDIHYSRLHQGGFDLKVTREGEEAIKLIKEDEYLTIRGAIIDEMLKKPDDPDSKATQVYQGKDVINEIKKLRGENDKDFVTVMVSGVPESQPTAIEGLKSASSLKNITGSQVFCKYVLKEDYELLIRYLKDNIKDKPSKREDVLFILNNSTSQSPDLYYIKDKNKIDTFRKDLKEEFEKVLNISDKYKLSGEKPKEKVNGFLKQHEKLKKIYRIEIDKDQKQRLSLFKAVGLRTIQNESRFFSKDEIADIINTKGNKNKFIKTFLCRFNKALLELLNFGGKLHEFNRECDRYEIKYNVLDIDLIFEVMKQLHEGEKEGNEMSDINKVKSQLSGFL